MIGSPRRRPEATANLTAFALLCFAVSMWVLPWLAGRARSLDWLGATALRGWILVAGVGVLLYEVGRRFLATWTATRQWTPSAIMLTVTLVLVVGVGLWGLLTILGAGSA